MARPPRPGYHGTSFPKIERKKVPPEVAKAVRERADQARAKINKAKRELDSAISQIVHVKSYTRRPPSGRTPKK